MTPQNITLTTTDNYKLSALYWQGNTLNAVIYLHQNNRDKNDVNVILQPLLDRGYHVVSVDLRGYGESQGDRSRFTDKDYQAMFNDVRSADEYLKAIDEHMSVQVVGSSIGANTALVYQEMNTLESVVALSPGFDYFGIKTEDSNLINIAMPILYINTQGDKTVEETKKLFADSPITPDGLNKLGIYSGNEHGIDILKSHPEALNDVLLWLDEHAGKGLAVMKSVSQIRVN